MRLKELRAECNLSQQAIADKLHIARISYLHWEQGKTEPSINALCMLCEIFDVSADYLLGIESNTVKDYKTKNYIHNVNNHGNMTIK